MDSKTHKFTHIATDGTPLSLEVDLSGDEVKISTKLNMADHMELAEEFELWVESILNSLMPLLTEAQLRSSARKGLKKIYG